MALPHTRCTAIQVPKNPCHQCALHPSKNIHHLLTKFVIHQLHLMPNQHIFEILICLKKQDHNQQSKNRWDLEFASKKREENDSIFYRRG
jgi:hypothetical protein